jgi:hypothetical protein
MDELRVVPTTEQPETFEAWLEDGVRIAQRRSRNNYELGDWWIRGEHKHGARLAMTERPDWPGERGKTCMNKATVCRRFPPTSRYRELSYSHLACVTALLDREANSLLDWAMKPMKDGKRPRTVMALRAERERREEAQLRRQEARDRRHRVGLIPVVKGEAGPVVPIRLAAPYETRNLGPLVPPYELPPRTAAEFDAQLDQLVDRFAGDLSMDELADRLAAKGEALRRKQAS